MLGHGELKAKLRALDASQALIEFDLDGTVVAANANFLATLGYRLDEQQAAVAQEMSAGMQAMTGAVGEISRTVGAIAASTREVDAAARLVRDASRSMAG